MWNPLFFIFIIITLSLSIIMIFLGRIISNNSPDLQKNSPYECGFDPINSPRLPFSFRFFLIAILFLIFDLEIALLLILPLITCNNNPTISTPFIIIFLIIITIGLYYEWVQGGLEWAEN